MRVERKWDVKGYSTNGLTAGACWWWNNNLTMGEKVKSFFQSIAFNIRDGGKLGGGEKARLKDS